MPTYNVELGGFHDKIQRCRKKIQVIGGGFGNGKTTALVMKALQIAVNYPEANMLLARATYPKLNDTLRKEFYRWCPEGWVTRWPTKDDNTLYLRNGTVINFRYIAQRGKQSEDGSTTSNLLSATYDFVGIDQVEDPEIQFKDFRDMMGRLRGQTIYRPPDGEDIDETMPLNGPRWLVLTANPTFNWLYKEVVRPYQVWDKQGIRLDNLIVDEHTKEPIIEVFDAPTHENKSNLPADFISGLASTFKGQQYDRYVLGKWGAFEGLVYPDFDDKLHNVTDEQIEEYLQVLERKHVQLIARESYDFGITSPSCYLLSFIDDYGRVIIVDGFYRPNFKLEDQYEKIAEIRQKWMFKLNFKEPIFADPDVFRKKVIAGYKATGNTIASMFNDNGFILRPASNDILSGIIKVGSYLNTMNGLENPFNEAADGPLLFVNTRLEWIASEFQNYFWKQNPSGQRIDEPIDRDDHAMDAIKYLLAKLPDASEIVVPRDKQVPGWKFWHEVA